MIDESERVGWIQGPAASWLILLAGLSACSPGEERNDPGLPQPVSESPEVVHGTAVHGHEVRSFRPCGASEALWAIDSSGILWTLYQELAPDATPYPELYVILEGRPGGPPSDGFGVDYPGTMVVSRVLFVASEGDRCGADPATVRARAQGNEPFWGVTVASDSMTLHRLGYAPESRHGVLAGREASGAWFRGQPDPDLPDGPTLWILDRPCRDSMSGAYFHATARVDLGADILTGCAWMPRGEALPVGEDPPRG